MVRLLRVQEDEISERVQPIPGSEVLKAFGISLLCSLLGIFESDLKPDEMTEIERFCQDWRKSQE